MNVVNWKETLDSYDRKRQPKLLSGLKKLWSLFTRRLHPISADDREFEKCMEISLQVKRP